MPVEMNASDARSKSLVGVCVPVSVFAECVDTDVGCVVLEWDEYRQYEVGCVYHWW